MALFYQIPVKYLLNRVNGYIFAVRSRSSMDRMTDSGSVGWAFESPRDHKQTTNSAEYQRYCVLWGTYWGAKYIYLMMTIKFGYLR